MGLMCTVYCWDQFEVPPTKVDKASSIVAMRNDFWESLRSGWDMTRTFVWAPYGQEMGSWALWSPPLNQFFWWGGDETLLTQAKKNHNFVFWACFLPLWLLRAFGAKMCIFGRFPALAQKIYFIHFFRSDKNRSGVSDQISQFPPPSLTD